MTSKERNMINAKATSPNGAKRDKNTPVAYKLLFGRRVNIAPSAPITHRLFAGRRLSPS
jgi:hypothetical protein